MKMRVRGKEMGVELRLVARQTACGEEKIGVRQRLVLQHRLRVGREEEKVGVRLRLVAQHRLQVGRGNRQKD